MLGFWSTSTKKCVLMINYSITIVCCEGISTKFYLNHSKSSVPCILSNMCLLSWLYSRSALEIINYYCIGISRNCPLFRIVYEYVVGTKIWLHSTDRNARFLYVFESCSRFYYFCFAPRIPSSYTCSLKFNFFVK